ncbi:sigma-54 interaction domain-containing protein [Paragemmobacter straminiformis]|uniref:Nif-specific regulatory protein n=1 Tax=Paragemmobacter straminiformis TaxID=2045119 RepID=A0A842I5C9_9RHOB|nr:sigma 54-interacting transcriptional regulator [Gemmobacter straminiformis]MBC2834761.1 sigma 54-interacting transcriptional regulator [Gemmobacter straminiformis]
MTSEWLARDVAARPLPVAPETIDRIIVGDSAPIRQLKRLIAAVAVSDAAVVVTGPTGAGKELVAEALHRASGRSGPLVAVNCAAIPAELLESELFGHEKGAFTGADRARIGRIEQANGGTLFLDEIGDMPPALQAKLLRVLETRRVQRLGSNCDTPVDFRLVTATHRDLCQAIERGDFRSDLYYRINVFTLCVPSLAERTCDIPMILARMISDHLCQNPAADAPHFDLSAIRALAAHSWPGNIRELKNVLQRAFVMLPGRMVTARHVRDNLLGMAMPDPEGDDYALPEAAPLGGDMPDPSAFHEALGKLGDIDLRGYIRDIEVAMIEAALDKRCGNVAQAADMLRLRRTTLIEKMKKFGIRRGLDA